MDLQREQLEARQDAVLGDAPEGDGGVQGGAASEQPESMHVDGDGDAANEHLIPEAANAAAKDDDDEVADADLEDEAAVAAPAVPMKVQAEHRGSARQAAQQADVVVTFGNTYPGSL